MITSFPARRASELAQHLLGLLAHRQDLLLAARVDEGDDRRLVEHDAPAFDIDQRVGGAEVDGHVGGKHAAQIGKHMRQTPSSAGKARYNARSEEHTSELQSLMRNSYAVFCM